MRFAVKRDAIGQVERLKGQYVMREFKQMNRFDFNQRFVPTCEPGKKKEVKRLLLALGAHDDLLLHLMDDKLAFLNTTLLETVCIEQPEGLSSGCNEVCLLQRSPSGLRQEETGTRH